MKTPSRISQHQNMGGDTHAACSDSPPSTIPINPLPASPMNIFAGGKFQYRKPATAAANNKGSTAVPPSPASQYSQAAPRHAVMASTLAMPSMPSMKLYKLSNHTR
ncbi:hypothetical protein D3C76_1122900 [compost metagenome]